MKITLEFETEEEKQEAKKLLGDDAASQTYVISETRRAARILLVLRQIVARLKRETV